ncbi:sodium transporter [Microbulbifer flavimaris]|uniref:Sodium transporter n=1 Tax=Microbulbifer flavimaris TaxID=1781068 RepID=A0ABX4I388_9GAMM|nr:MULTISPECIES: sodium:solute symporter [Microbulbifer]KUJ84489.1 sodium transporter [Microbulbifer sp. ZGT114]PCO06576.1 sodium transporter [Microbulbifer flavimaris]
MSEFGLLNWVVLSAYLAVSIGIGAAMGRKVHSSQEFFLGDRSIPWWAIGISVVSTYVSALTFLGGPAWAYTDGLSVMAIHLNYPLVIFLVICFFLPFFYNSGVASIYEYQEKRFGPASRCVMAGVFLISQTLTTAAVLYATSLVLEFITGVPVETCIVIVTVAALLYTMMGGIAAVIWTDVLQAAILFIGAFIIVFQLLDEMPVPLTTALFELKGQGMTNAIVTDLDFSNVTTVWSGVIAMTLFHVTIYGANQMMVQRTLAAKNIGDAKKSFMMMGYGAFFIYFLFISLGVLFYFFYQGREFENGNTIILQFAAEYGFPGLMGLIAAAVLAASMSSLDSALNSMSTVSTLDFYKRFFRKDADDRHYLVVSRLFTIFWAALIIIPAMMFASSSGSILEILSKLGSYFVGAKLSMFALGFFTKNTTERGLLVGVAVGFAVLIYVANFTDVAWPWYAAIGGVVNMVVSYVASRVLDGTQAEYSEYTIAGQKKLFAESGRAEKEGNWYVLPGRVDRQAYGLLVFFALSVAFLVLFNQAIS